MNMTLGCSALRRISAGSVSMRSMTAQPVGRVQGSSLRLRRPPVETMHGPAGIPETRFHFRQKCLRLGRVGNTCTSSCAHEATLRAQHKRRVFITFRGEGGQSHFGYGPSLRLIIHRALTSIRISEKNWPQRLSVHLPFRRSQLFPGERLATDAAATLHVLDGQGLGRTLRAPYLRQLTLTRGAGH